MCESICVQCKYAGGLLFHEPLPLLKVTGVTLTGFAEVVQFYLTPDQSRLEGVNYVILVKDAAIFYFV